MSDFTGKVNIPYLNNAAQIFAPIKKQSYRNMKLENGSYVLDAGCGPGIDAIELSRLISPDGKVFGIDNDREMITQAQKQAISLGVSAFIEFMHCNIYKLPFRSGFFNSCRSERLFMHLHNPEKALSEIHRVTKSGGKVVIVETDWSSLSIDCQSTEIENVLNQYRINHFLANGNSGRSLYRLFKENHFSEIEIEVFPLHTSNLELFSALSLQEAVENQALSHNIISSEALVDWRSELKHAAERGTFFCSVNIIMATGRKSV